jgi:hypothetical protein
METALEDRKEEWKERGADEADKNREKQKRQ